MCTEALCGPSVAAGNEILLRAIQTIMGRRPKFKFTLPSLKRMPQSLKKGLIHSHSSYSHGDGVPRSSISVYVNTLQNIVNLVCQVGSTVEFLKLFDRHNMCGVQPRITRRTVAITKRLTRRNVYPHEDCKSNLRTFNS